MDRRISEINTTAMDTALEILKLIVVIGYVASTIPVDNSETHVGQPPDVSAQRLVLAGDVHCYGCESSPDGILHIEHSSDVATLTMQIRNLSDSIVYLDETETRLSIDTTVYNATEWMTSLHSSTYAPQSSRRLLPHCSYAISVSQVLEPLVDSAYVMSAERLASGDTTDADTVLNEELSYARNTGLLLSIAYRLPSDSSNRMFKSLYLSPTLHSENR